MDVTCPRCGTEYEFDEALVAARGTSVKCTTCRHLFRVYPPTPAPAKPWLVRRAGERPRRLAGLKELQVAIRRGSVRREDELSRGDERYRPLADIAELASLFPGGGAPSPSSDALPARSSAPAQAAPPAARTAAPAQAAPPAEPRPSADPPPPLETPPAARPPRVDEAAPAADAAPRASPPPPPSDPTATPRRPDRGAPATRPVRLVSAKATVEGHALAPSPPGDAVPSPPSPAAPLSPSPASITAAPAPVSAPAALPPSPLFSSGAVPGPSPLPDPPPAAPASSPVGPPAATPPARDPAATRPEGRPRAQRPPALPPEPGRRHDTPQLRPRRRIRAVRIGAPAPRRRPRRRLAWLGGLALAGLAAGGTFVALSGGDEALARRLSEGDAELARATDAGDAAAAEIYAAARGEDDDAPAARSRLAWAQAFRAALLLTEADDVRSEAERDPEAEG
ncbi:MAG: zinc-ribbon domain-containing protein, partial [Myxococcota bacterium]